MEDVTIGDEMSLNDHRAIPGDHGICLWTNSDRWSKANGHPASGLKANNNQYKLLVNSER